MPENPSTTNILMREAERTEEEGMTKKERMEEGLSRIHKNALILMQEFDRIARKYRIRYWMEGGTLIGAVRHKGPIPWDDDIDYMIPREDYELLRRVLPDELGEDFVFIEPKDYPAGTFFDFIPRLVFLPSRIQNPNKETRYYGEILNHLVIDFFIVDDAVPGFFRHKMQTLLLKIVYGLPMGRRYHLDYKSYGFLKGSAVLLLSKIGKLIPRNRILQWYEKISRYGEAERFHKERKNSREVIFSNYLYPVLGRRFPSRWFKRRVRIPYDCLKLPAPVEYDAFLRSIYGDYMQLPPEENQKPEHANPWEFTIDEEKSEYYLSRLPGRKRRTCRNSEK